MIFSGDSFSNGLNINSTLLLMQCMSMTLLFDQPTSSNNIHSESKSRLNIDLIHRQSLFVCLLCYEISAKHLRGHFMNFCNASSDLYSTRFTASTSMNLCFYYPNVSLKLLCCGFSFIWRACYISF
ncbi:MAG: hypothetical protein Ct9H90mP13_05100 [Pseudomonadota bacterium]|nr:MAG: hypothetical protein Ct9H90mP13_05100 [Pseudomonadota bacterium]